MNEAESTSKNAHSSDEALACPTERKRYLGIGQTVINKKSK